MTDRSCRKKSIPLDIDQLALNIILGPDQFAALIISESPLLDGFAFTIVHRLIRAQTFLIETVLHPADQIAIAAVSFLGDHMT